MANRRFSQRQPLKQPVTVTLSSGEEYGALLLDISFGGAAIWAAESISIGSTVKIDLKLPVSAEMLSFRALCNVTATSTVDHPEGFILSMQFTDITGDDQRNLARFMKLA